MGTFGMGCAVSDYNGYLGHETDWEAKLVGLEIAFSGVGEYTGTYAFTVDYNNSQRLAASDPYAPIRIRSYRNPVAGAFTNEAAVLQNGDALKNSAGDVSASHNPAIPAGKFSKQWSFLDTAADCQFFDNFEDGVNLPIIALCYNAPQREADYRDRSLNADYPDLDAFINDVLSSAQGTKLPLDITSITINGQTRTLANTLELETVSNGSLHVGKMLADLSTAGGQDFIRTLLDNTDHREAVTLEFSFSGGMHLRMPQALSFSFDHNELAKLLN